MTLYGEMTKADWMKALHIKDENIPTAFILHGEWEHAWNIEIWKELLAEEQWIPTWNAITGNYNQTRIGFANVFGGPQAAMIAHRFAMLGTEIMIQTGYFGGLSKQASYGDIFIVTGAYMEDGVSRWYLSEQDMVYADLMLVNEAIAYCEEMNYSYVTGKIYTTSAMLMETKELVEDWSNRGFIGVDMETATTFAIASKYNRRAVGLLNLSDHLVQGDTMYSRIADYEQIEERTDQRIREIALYLSSLGK
ncbi:phosphorylase family protein [Oceanobacillus picturae]|uniref:phosphorylase family protein n=1 Tax=Oceanobacillus picturae TaxID=171693 RepID=UPI00363790BC